MFLQKKRKKSGVIMLDLSSFQWEIRPGSGMSGQIWGCFTSIMCFLKIKHDMECVILKWNYEEQNVEEINGGMLCVNALRESQHVWRRNEGISLRLKNQGSMKLEMEVETCPHDFFSCEETNMKGREYGVLLHLKIQEPDFCSRSTVQDCWSFYLCFLNVFEVLLSLSPWISGKIFLCH